MRITIIDQQTSAARDYNVGSTALVGAVAIVVARELGYEQDAERFRLATMSGVPLVSEQTVGTACRPGGIYTLLRIGPNV